MRQLLHPTGYPSAVHRRIPGSTIATLALVPEIPQKKLRNEVGEILRRAEAGERFTITVSGRPVAELGPIRSRTWVDSSVLEELAKLPVDENLADDIREFDIQLRDPWAER
jgi:prevent-host-death family protein